jgi:hypothetical protein
LTTDEEIAACAARIVRVRELYTGPPLLLGRARIDLSRLWDGVAVWALMTAIQESDDDDSAFDPLLTDVIR